MEEHKLARLLDQFQAMRRAAMSSVFSVAATQHQAGKAATAATIAEKIGAEIPDAATLNSARKAAIRSSARTYDAPSVELPMAAASDEARATSRMQHSHAHSTYPCAAHYVIALFTQQIRCNFALARWRACAWSAILSTMRTLYSYHSYAIAFATFRCKSSSCSRVGRNTVTTRPRSSVSVLASRAFWRF